MATTISEFGRSARSFQLTDAREVFLRAGTDALRGYLLAHFAKLKRPSGVAEWEPSVRTVLIHSHKEFAAMVPSKVCWEREQGGVKETVHPHAMVHDFALAYTTVDTRQGRAFMKDTLAMINLFGGWLHSGPAPEVPAPEDAAAGVRLWLEHLREVWASGNAVVFQFLVRWFARIAQLGKNEVGLYLKSGQGAGKSCVFDFLAEHVFGHEATLVADRPEVVSGFNHILQGKALVCLEEMPTATEGEYLSLANQLKVLLTGREYLMKRKYHDDMVVQNTMSIAVLSNRNALKFENSDRRWAMLDISESRIGDEAYFRSLAAANTREVGLAFFHFLLGVDLREHKDLRPPETEARAEKQAETIPHVFQFLKERYLSHGGGIPRQKFGALYDSYREWFAREHGGRATHETKIAVSKALSNVGISTILASFHGEQGRLLALSFADLRALFVHKGWLHDIDEVPPAGAVAGAGEQA